MGYMIQNLLMLWLVVAIFLYCIPVVHAASEIPGPINVPTTESTQEPTNEPTTIQTPIPTTVPTTIPVTAPTTESTITITPKPIGGGKGWIDTYCNVDGATVSFDGSTQGTIAGGVLSVGVSPSGTPVLTITVSKGGYTSWSGSLSHMPADQEHVAVYATINPLPTPPSPPVPPQNGAIYAQSSPGGAAIYLNGVFYGYAQLTIPNLQPNSYSMKATLSGYSSDSQIVTVYPGQTAMYYPQLQPSPL
ncbi:MAG: PEGA domain-containing protein, partial [Methanoregula sp.]|nr:PEGA domain-containing protein [Methanoregula sp.]